MNPQPRKHLHRLLSIPFILCAAAGFLLAGCGFSPLHGGRATSSYHKTGALTQSLIQGDNPSQSTTQTQEQVKLRSYVLPAGTRIESLIPPASAPRPSGPAPGLSTFNSQLSAFVVPSPVPVTEREESRTRTELGAAQRDTTRELGARLASLKGIVWVGVALFTLGLGSLFWPPLRLLVSSTTTSIAIALGGIALVILPTLIVGHEMLIFAGVALVVGAWFFAHRHGHARGQLSQLRAQTTSQDRA